jgi:hypothetical protein
MSTLRRFLWVIRLRLPHRFDGLGDYERELFRPDHVPGEYR